MFLRPTFLFILLFSLISTFNLYASPKVKMSKEPEWLLPRKYNDKKTAKLTDISNGYYISFYDEQINTAEQSRYVKVVKNIVNESGVQYNSEIAVSFAGTYQTIFFHEISIIRDGKKINKLSLNKIKVINTEPGLSDYQIYDHYKAFLVLDDVRKGDQIVFSYTKKGFNPIYNNKYNDYLYFYSSTIILNNFCTIITPKGTTLNYKAHNDAPTPNKKDEGKYTIYDWPNSELEDYEFDNYIPSWYTGYKYVEVSEYNNWKEVADWASNILLVKSTDLPYQLKEQIEEWSKSSNGDKEKFALKALRFVQNEVRYLGMEIGEYSHRPHPAKETFINRYGDCKDKSLLLATILKKKGINTSLVLVNTQYRERIEDVLPRANVFNHVIVKATIDGRDHYLDPTISGQGGDLRSNYIPNYGAGLVVDGQSTSLSLIPFNANSSIDIEESYEVSYDTISTFHVTTIYKGYAADDIRSSLRQSNLGDLQSSYEDYYSSACECDMKMDRDLLIEDDSVKNIISIKEHYITKDIWVKGKEENYIPTFCQSVYEKLSDPDNINDEKPLHLSYPTDLNHSIKLYMPEIWELDKDKGTINSDYYRFSYNIDLDGSMIDLNYSLKTFKDHIPVKDIDQYKKDYENIVSNISFYITRNEKLLANIDKVNKAGIGKSINWIAVFLGIITLGVSFFILKNANKKSTNSPYDELGGYGISGWLILLAIVLFIRPILYLFTLFNGGYLETETWLIITSAGQTGLQLLLMLELIMTVFFTVFCVWNIFWFLKRRDIFPKMFVLLTLIELGSLVLFAILTNVFKDEVSNVFPELAKTYVTAIFKHLVFMAIWVTAVLRSTKVKNTFVIKHSSYVPEYDNTASSNEDHYNTQ